MNIEQKLNKIEQELAEVKQEMKKEKEEWIPKNKETYWFYDKDREEPKTTYWSNTKTDNTRLKNKVIFKTEEEAKRYADYQKAKEEYSYEFSKEEWGDDNLRKYFVYYNYRDKEVFTDYANKWKYLGVIYFQTKEQAQEFIDKYKDEILEFEFGIKEE